MMAEHIHQEFTRKLEPGAPESIHLCSWPKADGSKIDPALEEAFFSAQEIIEASMAARNAAAIKLRYPVREILVLSSDEKMKAALEKAGAIIARMANCKSVSAVQSEPAGKFAKGVSGDVTVFVSSDFDESLLGESAGREITRKIQQMRKDNGFSVSQRIELELGMDEKTERILSQFLPAMREKVGASSLSISRISGGAKVFCDTIDLKELGLGGVEIGFSKAE
jgi:isoleucyl-tRNA synthetase